MKTHQAETQKDIAMRDVKLAKWDVWLIATRHRFHGVRVYRSWFSDSAAVAVCYFFTFPESAIPIAKLHRICSSTLKTVKARK